MTDRKDGIPETLNRADYVRRILDEYRRTPGTTGHVRQPDRVLAQKFYQQGIAFESISNALVLAAVRRLIRPAGVPSLPTVRSLAYFLPVIAEVQEADVGAEYYQYVRQKLQQMLGASGRD